MKRSFVVAAVAAASLFLPSGLRPAEAAPSPYPAPGSTLVCTTSFHSVNADFVTGTQSEITTDGSGTCVDQGTLATFPFRFGVPFSSTNTGWGCPAPSHPLFFDIGTGRYGFTYWKPTSLLLGLGLPVLTPLLSLGFLAQGVTVPQIQTGVLDASYTSEYTGVLGGSATFVGTENCRPSNGTGVRSRAEYQGQMVLTVTVGSPPLVG